MLKLRINTTKGPVDKDTNISPMDISQIQYLEVIPRGSEGVGSFKGRSPNKVTIWSGPRAFRNVVLPDNFDWDTVKGFTIYDSTKTQEELHFDQSESNPKVLWANQPKRQEEQTKGTDRWATMILAFQKQFPAAGGIGCNDTGDSLIVTVEVPADHNTREYREALAAFAQEQTTRFNCTVEVIVKPVGAVGGPKAQPLLQDKLGEPRYPTIPVAGQQNVQLVNAGAHPTPASATALRPFEGGPEGEQPLEVGQSFEPYGSEGPQDNK